MPRKSSSSSSPISDFASSSELRFEHFFSNFLKHEGLSALLICFVCLIIVVAVAIYMLRTMFFATDAKTTDIGKLQQKRKTYNDLLGHIRALESLRNERELLGKRVLRVIQGWQKKDENRTAAPGCTADVIDDLADELRIMKREHQLLTMNCTAALGERDTAGVFRVDPQTQVWQSALQKAQKELMEENRMSDRQIEEIEEDQINEITKEMMKKKE